MNAGEVISRGPHEVKWIVYGDQGQVWSAAYLHGDLVRANAAGWYILDKQDPSRHVAVTGDELASIVACAPGPEEWPILPDQVALIPPVEQLPPTSWTEIDIGPIVDGLVAGHLERPRPTVGRRADGEFLFYEKRVNSVFGESGDGKSWFVLTVAGQEIAGGNDVVWVDFEDDEIGVVGRLLDIGADPALTKMRFHYISPHEPFSTDAQAEITEMVTACKPTLVVIDSAGESMAVDGVGGNNDDEVARWTRRVPRYVADLGPAVVLIDHVPKATGTGKLFAIGSQRKRAAVSGLAVLVECIAEFGIDMDGRSKITVAKDRCGHHVRGKRVADFHLDASGDECHASIVEPVISTTVEGTFRPTGLMESVSRWLEINAGATKNAIVMAVKGKREWVLVAIDTLVAEGNVTVEAGSRNAVYHRVISPFRESGGGDQ